METQLAKAARNIYRYFAGQIDLQQVKSSFIYLFTGNESLPVGESVRDTPLGADFEHLVSAMQYDSMLNDWNKVMSATAELTDKDANRFLRQLFDSVESDQQFFKYLNVAARALCVKDSWTDHSILRPQTKAGWTIHVTLKGAGYYNCVRTTLQTQPGDILLFSPTAYLEVRRAEDCDQWLYAWVMFQDEGVIKDMLNWPEIASGIHHIRTHSQKKLTQITSIIEFLAQQGWDKDPVEVKIRATCVEHLMLRCHQIMESEGYHRTDPRVQSAIRFVEDNLFADLSIDKIADAACLSASALALLFKKYSGISIMQWREEKRIAAACNKLIHTDRRIVQIADELGYVNQMYFSRCFRKYMKMPPSDYRSQHKLTWL